jgi:hypothetical protein
MASAEARSPSLRKLVWHNLELLQDALSYSDGHERAADLICQSLPEKFDIMRVHVGGDYFSRNYFLAWCLVAERNPDKVFYSYTKSLPIIGGIPKPDNLVLTASRGGKWDNLLMKRTGKKLALLYTAKKKLPSLVWRSTTTIPTRHSAQKVLRFYCMAHNQRAVQQRRR